MRSTNLMTKSMTNEQWVCCKVRWFHKVEIKKWIIENDIDWRAVGQGEDPLSWRLFPGPGVHKILFKKNDALAYTLKFNPNEEIMIRFL